MSGLGRPAFWGMSSLVEPNQNYVLIPFGENTPSTSALRLLIHLVEVENMAAEIQVRTLEVKRGV